MSHSAETRSDPQQAMIDSQLKVCRVTDERVLDALRRVPRERFVPAQKHALAYADADVVIAPGRVLMQPMVFGRLLVAAAIEPHHTILVVGGGMGYSAAVLANLGQHVVCLESNTELFGRAKSLLQSHSTITLHTGPLNEGHAARAPYDIIFIDGGADHIPQPLIDQLADDGLMVGIMNDRGVGRGFTARKTTNVLGINPFMDAHAVILPGLEKPRHFKF